MTEYTLERGNTLRQLQLPPRTLIIMVRRGEDFFVPTGSSELQVGDQLLVISDKDAEQTYKQMTDQVEEDAIWRAQMRAQFKARLDKIFGRKKR